MFFLSSVLISCLSRLQLFGLPSLRPPRTFRTLRSLLSCAALAECPRQAPEQRRFWCQMFPDVTRASVPFACSIHRQSVISLMQSSFRTKVSFLRCFQEWDWAATGMSAAAAAMSSAQTLSRRRCPPREYKPFLAIFRYKHE